MNKSTALYLVSFLEGSALMGAELIGAKIMAPYYGNSLVVWTSVFVCTLSGLALGYYLGGKISSKSKVEKNLFKILLFSAIAFALMSPLSSFMMELSLSLPIELGSLLSVMVFLFPILVAFGMVSPMIIQMLTNQVQDAGKNAGSIYTISTIGGIFTTLIVGLYAIPTLGIKISIVVLTAALVIASTLTYVTQKSVSK